MYKEIIVDLYCFIILHQFTLLNSKSIVIQYRPFYVMSLDDDFRKISVRYYTVRNPLTSNQQQKIETSFHSAVLHFRTLTRVDLGSFAVYNYYFEIKKVVQNTSQNKQRNNLHTDTYTHKHPSLNRWCFQFFFIFAHQQLPRNLLWQFVAICLLYSEFITTRVAMGKLVGLKQSSWDCSWYCVWIIMNDK